jgi:pullulanase
MTGSGRTLARAALLAIALASPRVTTAQSSVVIAGSLQSELGCTGDWDPACAATGLAFDATDRVWQRTFNVPAGSWEYKAALDGTWTVNYGANAQQNGANIAFTLPAAANVKFYFDPTTHWVTSSADAVIATAPGSYQSELGCPGDWQPDCLRSWLEDPDGDGIYTFTTSALPAGSYEVKVALNETWDVNYGAGGVQNGPNIPFVVPSDCATVTFAYDSATHLLTVTIGAAPAPQPASVTIAGSLQSELGCAADWDPGCAATRLAYDASDDVWQATFPVPAGSWEYKAALNGSWDENYGLHAQRDGPNIPFDLAAPASVKFYYDHKSHWITSSANDVIATAPGSFQSELGCPGDWQPDCLRSWLEDPDGDGIYTFTTTVLPAGSYEAKVALNESWDVNYGAGGVQNGANIPFTVPAACAAVTFRYDSATHELTILIGGERPGNLGLARAHWVTRDTIAWNSGRIDPGTVFRLHADPTGSGALALSDDGVSGGIAFDLTVDPAGLSADVRARFPHLAGYTALKLPADAVAAAADLLRGQLAVSKALGGVRLDATSMQIPGVLDDLYFFGGKLGVTFDRAGVPSIRVWAPTARSVKLHLFDGPGASAAEAVLPMAIDGATGTWTVRGDRSWYGKFYLHEVEVFVRSERSVVHNLVTDPYSISLSMNSLRSQIVDLRDPALAPWGWDSLEKPRLRAPTDIVLYELHVRDFSAGDPTVPAAHRGTFLAFTDGGSTGMTHLRRLADAGLTHVHVLPAFDFATVNEDRSTWLEPACALASFPPDSTEQQACTSAVAGQDGFNWGYDPLHYTVPEGSYSTAPDGPARIREFRAMVKALNEAGLRVVMDVVYNHTNASGQAARSVLDRVVPGYYHRLDADGNVETSTCCQNTASEHRMMEKLMVDSVVTWARDYKVDGFRFDLMGHHMKSNMLAVRAALDGLVRSRDGVDGKAIYVYGEGWNFGEVANNARGVNATQLNMAGTGIGTFSDRLRDRVRGGGPFSPRPEQGFATGLFLDANGATSGTPDEQRALLLQFSDVIRVGLAGNLADFPLLDATGTVRLGRELDYNGQPAGYALRPDDTITYISAHDNETWFDALQVKVPSWATLSDRLRVSNLGVSIVALAQGVPFFHAGDELLRSKSGDKNSYDSGDWWNRIDFTGLTSAWGSGLPPASSNQADWPILSPLLARAGTGGADDTRPGQAQIALSQANFEEMVRIRRSTPLLHLATACEIETQLSFLNVGPAQIPGLVVMRLTPPPASAPCGTASVVPPPAFGQVVALVNAAPEARTFTAAALAGQRLRLHPVQRASADLVVRGARFDCRTGTFTVPARTTAVFVSQDARAASRCED